MDNALPPPRATSWNLQHLLLLLQILSSVAMSASYVRVVSQRVLSVYGLVIPCFLFVAILVKKTSFIPNRLSSIIVGLTTGSVAGVLSDVVVDDLMASSELLQEVSSVCKLCSLELLNFPVILCVVVSCFYSGCVRYCTLRRSFALVVLLFSIIILYSVLRLIVKESVCELIIVFVLVGYFVMFNMLRIPVRLQSWFLWLVLCVVSCYWQMRYLDTLYWDLRRYYLPVSGSVVGMTVSFLLSCMHSRDCVTFTRQGYTTFVQEDSSLKFAIIAHVVAFVFVRELVTALKTLGLYLSTSSVIWPRSDFWLCTLSLLGCLALSLNLIADRLSICMCLIFTGLIFATYICIGVVNGLVTNGYLIDDVVALSLVMLMVRGDESADTLTQPVCVDCNDS